MSLFLDPIFKWQWKHYIMFGKKKKNYLNRNSKITIGKLFILMDKISPGQVIEVKFLL